jgi:hypothetical protein
LLAIAALAAAFSVNAPAEIDDAQLEAFEVECSKYASEEGIAEEDKDAYIAKCVREMVGTPTEGAASESEEASDEE